MLDLNTLSLVCFVFINPKINMSLAQLRQTLTTLSPPSYWFRVTSSQTQPHGRLFTYSTDSTFCISHHVVYCLLQDNFHNSVCGVNSACYDCVYKAHAHAPWERGQLIEIKVWQKEYQYIKQKNSYCAGNNSSTATAGPMRFQLILTKVINQSS